MELLYHLKPHVWQNFLTYLYIYIIYSIYIYILYVYIVYIICVYTVYIYMHTVGASNFGTYLKWPLSILFNHRKNPWIPRLGMHADNEPDLDRDAPIVSASW